MIAEVTAAAGSGDGTALTYDDVGDGRLVSAPVEGSSQDVALDHIFVDLVALAVSVVHGTTLDDDHGVVLRSNPRAQTVHTVGKLRALEASFVGPVFGRVGVVDPRVSGCSSVNVSVSPAGRSSSGPDTRKWTILAGSAEPGRPGSCDATAVAVITTHITHTTKRLRVFMTGSASTMKNEQNLTVSLPSVRRVNTSVR